MRMNGYNVMFPIGLRRVRSAGGERGHQARHPPQEVDVPNIDSMRKQMRSMGAMFDWEREAVSADPEYYKWTEWFFIAVVQARAGLPQDVARGLVPELQHDAGARAGLGRGSSLRTLRHACDQEGPGAVVLQASPSMPMNC